jgi:hypothetical protein
MENFFYEDKFYSDLGDFIDDLFYDDLTNIKDEWTWVCQECDLEPIFQITKDDLCDMIHYIGSNHEERYPEDSDDVNRDLEVAIKQTFNIDDLNAAIPKLYYPNGKKFTITKLDILDYAD